MDVSVVVCTRNRASQLSKLLSSMTKLTIPAGTSWELIVVDNGSNDNTPTTIASFQNVLPIKQIFEPTPGLSNARNSGIDAGTGRYFVWTDDDVLVEPNWLAAYCLAFKRWPHAAVFGGKITPVLEAPTPDWFESAMSDLGDMLAKRDFGSEPTPLAAAKEILPFGANFAISAGEQKQHRYDAHFGVAPDQGRVGEETAVIKAILAENNSGWWVPEAEVKHIIPPSRQTTGYIFRYYEAAGETRAYSSLKEGAIRYLTVPLATGLKLPIAFMRFYLAHKLRSKSWVRYLASYAHHHGKFKYWIASQTDAKKQISRD